MNKKVRKIVTRSNVLVIIREVGKRMRKLQRSTGGYGVYFSKKNLSELASKVTEKVASDFFTEKLKYSVVNAEKDSDPDLYFTKIDVPVEVKVTSTDRFWTGGEFSKRPFHYLLLSWGEDFNRFFVCVVKLKKADWKSQLRMNYYGTVLSAKNLKKIREKSILVGSISDKGRIIRENIL